MRAGLGPPPPEAQDGSQASSLALLNRAFFQVQVMPSLGRVGVGETAKGSCVFVDLKLIKFASSSPSVGRLGRLPPGLLLLENISTIQSQDSLSL